MQRSIASVAIFGVAALTLVLAARPPVEGSAAGEMPSRIRSDAATSTPTRTPTSTATPTTTSPPSSPPAMYVFPSSVPAGSTFLAEGRGFGSSETVIVTYTADLSNGSTTVVQASTTSYANGVFVIPNIPVPAAVTPGTYQVTANGQTSHVSMTVSLVVLSAHATITPTATRQPTASATPRLTSTLSPTPHPTHTPTPTITPTPTATRTPRSTPTATSVPVKSYYLAIKYAYLWYPTVRMGTWEHVVVQANHRQRLTVLVYVIFPSGVQKSYAGRTNKLGHWEKTFPVPPGTASPYSSLALAIVQLRHELSVKSDDLKFWLVPPGSR